MLASELHHAKSDSKSLPTGGDKTGIDVVTSCPCHVLGPLLCKAHDTIWQHRLGEIFAGRYSIDMMWNICDVRDIAQSQRLMLETEAATNVR